MRKQTSIDILGPETGARIIIHDPYSLPFIAEDGINVRPHDMSAIEVKKGVFKRLEPPYGNCVRGGKHLKFKLSNEQPYSILVSILKPNIFFKSNLLRNLSANLFHDLTKMAKYELSQICLIYILGVVMGIIKLNKHKHCIKFFFYILLSIKFLITIFDVIG